jgi:hypothetical protein
MLDAKIISDIEQARSALVELMPPLWKSLFDSCVSQGFSESDAMRLVCAYIVGQSPHGTRPQ